MVGKATLKNKNLGEWSIMAWTYGKPVNEKDHQDLALKMNSMEHSLHQWCWLSQKPTWKEVEELLDEGTDRIVFTDVDGVQVTITGYNTYRIGHGNYRNERYDVGKILGLK